MACGVAAAPIPKPGPAKSTTDPAGFPLALEIAGEAEYVLDRGGRTAGEYRKAVEDGRVASPPTHFRVVVRNTGDQDIKIWTEGTSVTRMLFLKDGPGVAQWNQSVAVNAVLNFPTETSLGPGKTVEFKYTSITNLIETTPSSRSVWTEPGEYELVARFWTAANPAPKGVAASPNGFASVVLTSAPFKIKVVEKK